MKKKKRGKRGAKEFCLLKYRLANHMAWLSNLSFRSLASFDAGPQDSRTSTLLKRPSPIAQSATARASFFSLTLDQKRKHNAATDSGTLGSADEQTKLQCLEDLRDVESEAGGGAAHNWYGALAQVLS